jgi:hypothetical protein
MADARRLRNIGVESFAQRTAKAKTLRGGLDDGFELVDREDIVYLRLLLVQWEVKPGFSSPYADVWALAEFKPNDIRKVKFRDGGTSPEGIPATLEQLTKNGTGSDVMVALDFQEYDFTDRETGETRVARRYFFTDPQNQPDDEIPAEPNF